jgi:Zn ribbon nucleic-acid-binding protein
MEYTISGPKRFIAGAVCPQCKAADKTVTFAVKRFVPSQGQALVETDDEIMACVSCSFEQSKLELSVAPHGTSVNQDEAMPVKIRDATRSIK